jgi:hypothetical protein
MIFSLWIFYLLFLLLKLEALKVLLASIDNRDFDTDIRNIHYPSVCALLNKYYADYHGYDFVQVREVHENLEEEVKIKYSSYDTIPKTDNQKDAATAFHVGLKQFRAASWAKLPGIWSTMMNYRPFQASSTSSGNNSLDLFYYDLIFYIDSDAFISPYYLNISIQHILRNAKHNNLVTRGSLNPLESAFVFFNNHPWRDDMPCAGKTFKLHHHVFFVMHNSSDKCF